MKKILILTLALMMVLGVAVTASASVFDNWKGVLQGRDRTVDGWYYGDAEGEVILNYRKGKKDYIVNLSASGLEPGQEYEVKFYMGEPGSTAQQVVGDFIADGEGDGHLNIRGFEPDITAFDTFNTPSRFLVFKGAWRVLTTSGTAVEGAGEDIEPVGSNRGE